MEFQMKWIDVRHELPNDDETVLIFTNETNVFGPNRRLMREHVATFRRGRTATEVAATRRQEFADEYGNNLRPFRWVGDGPCSWFGQEVTHWARIIPPEGVK